VKEQIIGRGKVGHFEAMPTLGKEQNLWSSLGLPVLSPLVGTAQLSFYETLYISHPSHYGLISLITLRETFCITTVRHSKETKHCKLAAYW